MVSTKMRQNKAKFYRKDSPWSMSSNVDLASGCRNKDLGVKIINCNCKNKTRKVFMKMQLSYYIINGKFLQCEC